MYSNVPHRKFHDVSTSHTHESGLGRPRRLTPQQAMDLRDAYQLDRVPTAVLGQRYGISQQAAYNIATGKTYAELYHLPNPNRVSWVDPMVRRRGTIGEIEYEGLAHMLRAHPGRWALVKKTKGRPMVETFKKHGIQPRVSKLSPNEWGVYVCWPADAELLSA